MKKTVEFSNGRTFPINSLQSVFLVFYAIFWSGIFNAQSRMRAFQWALYDFRPARNWTFFSCFILNLLPVGYFIFAMLALRRPNLAHPSMCLLLWGYARTVFAAFTIFGICRIWGRIIELSPNSIICYNYL